MKAALALVILGVCVALSVGSILDNCWMDETKCQEDECCVKIANFLGKCKKLKQEGENCATHQLKQPFKDHVNLVQCPCVEGTTCVKKEGLVGAVLGVCTVGEPAE